MPVVVVPSTYTLCSIPDMEEIQKLIHFNSKKYIKNTQTASNRPLDFKLSSETLGTLFYFLKRMENLEQ